MAGNWPGAAAGSLRTAISLFFWPALVSYTTFQIWSGASVVERITTSAVVTTVWRTEFDDAVETAATVRAWIANAVPMAVGLDECVLHEAVRGMPVPAQQVGTSVQGRGAAPRERAEFLVPAAHRGGFRCLMCGRCRCEAARLSGHLDWWDPHGDLPAEPVTIGQPEVVTTPEAAGVIPVRAVLAGEEPHGLVGDGEDFRAVGGLQIGLAGTLHGRHSAGQPSRREPGRGGERGAVHPGDPAAAATPAARAWWPRPLLLRADRAAAPRGDGCPPTGRAGPGPARRATSAAAGRRRPRAVPRGWPG